MIIQNNSNPRSLKYKKQNLIRLELKVRHGCKRLRVQRKSLQIKIIAPLYNNKSYHNNNNCNNKYNRSRKMDQKLNKSSQMNKKHRVQNRKKLQQKSKFGFKQLRIPRKLQQRKVRIRIRIRQRSNQPNNSKSNNCKNRIHNWLKASKMKGNNRLRSKKHNKQSKKNQELKRIR